MVAYVIADNEIQDPAAYAEYAKASSKAMEKYKGKFLVRGGNAQNLEGDWQPKRIIVIEFESIEHAKAWLNSEEYREPRRIKHSAAKVRTIVVEGFVP